MLFSIPILAREQPGGAGITSFVVQPLFHPGPVQRADRLSRALNKLTSELQTLLNALGRQPRHEALAEWTFHPPLDETTLELRLELNSGSRKGRFFFVGYPALDRKLYFTPSVPDLHFEVLPGQTLAERAVTVLTRCFRDQEKAGTFDWDAVVAQGKARLTTLEIELEPAALAKAPKKSGRALVFGGGERKDGADELRRVGRPLHLAYPDDLDRAVAREAEVTELARLLAGRDRRPIVLVGPRQVGKTAILHELVWRLCAHTHEGLGRRREVWLVSPARLISGMSYLGEWENRVQAILEHLETKDKILYFDDLLGLFTAGRSSASDLNVAQVLKPVLEKRTVRVLAEITPEAWRVLRERDRAFADLFQVLPVAETTEAETLRILVGVARSLEEKHRCTFSLGVVPTVFDLFRRFGGDAAFPGKAAGFLRRLAARSSAMTKGGGWNVEAGGVLRRLPAHSGGQAIAEHCVRTAFQEQTGLHPAFLDDQVDLSREGFLEPLRKQVMGQDKALEAFADVFVKLKARLNDPRRPLGTFLLLGPTGVGKTETAKALARFLFGDAERLLRFDLNEYVEGTAAARLAGTPREPEGLLTGALRRQPFSVVLFDEIEKAAPEVFDLLLAVLDEGRLTDALGRVADFTHALIVLTSNLGAREARAKLGFGAGGAEEQDAIYAGVAEKFFRPEFFNRLDRVIPFRPLAPAHLAGIARRLIAGLGAREGLRRRECLVNVLPAAMARLVELGHHPQLGARALKRVIEREVAGPLGRRLAALPPGTPTLATVDVVEGRFDPRLEPMQRAPRAAAWAEVVAQPRDPAAQRAWVTGWLEDLEVFLERVETELEETAPPGPIQAGQVSKAVARHSLCRAHCQEVRFQARGLARSLEPAAGAVTVLNPPKVRPTKVIIRQTWTGANPRIDRQRAAEALRSDLADLGATVGEDRDSRRDTWSDATATAPALALLREAALLEAMTAPPADDRPLALVFRALSELDTEALHDLARTYRQALACLWESAKTYSDGIPEEMLPPAVFQDLPTPTVGLWCQGLNLRRLLPAAAACVWTRRPDGTLGGILVSQPPAQSEAELRACLAQAAESGQTGWVETLGPVIHLWNPQDALTDFRSGLRVSTSPSPEEARAFLISALPLPAELNF